MTHDHGPDPSHARGHDHAHGPDHRHPAGDDPALDLDGARRGAEPGAAYVRLRGSDGKRLAVGINGAGVDPSGPAADVMGQADPWDDLLV